MTGDLLLEAFPLTWPERPRKPSYQRRTGKFTVGFGRARDEMMRELALLGAKKIIVSSNVPLRRDGLPYADAREPTDPGVAVYFERNAKPYVFACDSYTKVAHNLRAVGATVEAMRSIARHGATEMLEQAFTGFQALPAPAPREQPWWEVLGVSRSANEAAVKTAYRALADRHHPDKVGGNGALMTKINVAYDQACSALAVSR